MNDINDFKEINKIFNLFNLFNVFNVFTILTLSIFYSNCLFWLLCALGSTARGSRPR